METSRASVVAGAGLGAGLMYMLDPQGGRRRRALAKDQAVKAARRTQKAAEGVGRASERRDR